MIHPVRPWRQSAPGGRRGHPTEPCQRADVPPEESVFKPGPLTLAAQPLPRAPKTAKPSHFHAACGSSCWRRKGPQVAAERMIGGNLDENDPDAIRVLDPHLNQTPGLGLGPAQDMNAGGR